MKQFLTLSLLIISVSISFSQSRREIKIDTLVSQIAEKNKLLSSAIGFAGSRTIQYQRYSELKKIARRDELITLTKHENAVVRCYAFWALCDREENDLFSILLDRLNDEERVSRLFGCIGSYITVADFYIELLTKKYLITEDYYRPNHSSVIPREKRILDSLVLHRPNNLTYLEKVLFTHEPNEYDYDRVKELAQKGNYAALPALAKYQKKQDLELILSYKDTPLKTNMYPHPFYCLFMAIENFPNDYFLDFLDNYSEEITNKKGSGFSSYWRNFYKAVASYGNDAAIKILERPFKKEVSLKYHLDFITLALDKYPKKNYEELIVYIWREHKHIAKNSFEYLVKTNPKLTFELIKNYLYDFEEVYQGGDEEKMIPIVLPFAIEYDKEEATKLIAKNLLTNTITPFKQFVPFAIELKSDTFITPLLERIETEWNGYAFDKAIEILLSYEDDEINQNILNATKLNEKNSSAYEHVKKQIKNYKKK